MFKNVSIRTRLISSIALVAVLVLVTNGLDIRTNQQTTETFDTIQNETAPTLVLLSEIEAIGLKMVLESESITVISNEAEFLDDSADEDPTEELEAEAEEFAESLERFDAAIGRYLALGENEEEQALARAIGEAGRQLHAQGTELISLKTSGINGEDILEVLEEIEAIEDEFEGLVLEARTIESEELAEENELLNDTISNSRNIGIALLIITILILVAVSWMVISSVIAPIRNLQSAATAITRGDLKRRAKVQSQDELGALASAFNHMTDQVEQRIAESEASRAEAERSNQIKSAFLASMSHELRTPLNAIINYTKFVGKGDMGPVNQQQSETLNRVTTSSRHLLNLINDVLDMSKIESGSLTLFVQDDVNMTTLLENAISDSRSLLNEKPVELQAEIDPNLPLVRGDQQRIFQIILNVLSNACKFTEEGFVSIKAHASNGEILVEIKDTGNGIAPEDHAAVFDSFKQTSSGLRSGGGTGLGMPIAKSLAETHGGRLWYESEVDRGSTFFVALPVRAEHLIPTLAPMGEMV